MKRADDGRQFSSSVFCVDDHCLCLAATSCISANVPSISSAITANLTCIPTDSSQQMAVITIPIATQTANHLNHVR